MTDGNESWGLQRAEETYQYRELLIYHLDKLTLLFGDYLANEARGTRDESLFNNMLSEMLVLVAHLYPKIQGGGKKTELLLEEFKEFVPWLEDIKKPKAFLKERMKIPALFRLIIRAYDVLGLSNY